MILRIFIDKQYYYLQQSEPKIDLGSKDSQFVYFRTEKIILAEGKRSRAEPGLKYFSSARTHH